jgi:hypothetical protein
LDGRLIWRNDVFILNAIKMAGLIARVAASKCVAVQTIFADGGRCRCQLLSRSRMVIGLTVVLW